VFTEKDEDGNQVFKREYDLLVKGKNILVVEDLTTTGGSVRKVVDSVHAAGGSVKRVSVMVNRDPDLVTEKTVGAPLSSLGIVKADSYDESDCPLCKQGVPVNTAVGHGKKYLEKKK
jgi:orotate phosphoribosyltransferase